MARRLSPGSIKIGFEDAGRRIPISAIKPLHLVFDAIKATPKYAQIVASIREVGIIEPPVVAPDRDDAGQFLLLDGHLRIAVLKDMGHTDVVCLISRDDEAFTYNKRVNRIAIIQEHRMILKAIERGVSEERLAKALNVNVAHIKRKRHLLDGICAEVAFVLGHDPTRRIICASYAVDLAIKHSNDFRTILRDPGYQLVFPGTRIGAGHRSAASEAQILHPTSAPIRMG